VRGAPVACSTLFVRPGLFDIFFPTHFGRLRDMCEHVLAQPRTDGDERLLPVAPSPLANSASLLSIGAGFFSSYQPQDRRAPTDGVASSSGLPVGDRKSSVFTHTVFMETYAEHVSAEWREPAGGLLQKCKIPVLRLFLSYLVLLCISKDSVLAREVPTLPPPV